MKRDIHLVKEIFALLEDSEGIHTEILLEHHNPFPNNNATKVSYHLRLLHEANYIAGNVAINNDFNIVDWAALRLTWQGHEFYELLKDKEVLHKITSLSKEGLASMSFGILKDVAKKMIESKAEKLLGLTSKA